MILKVVPKDSVYYAKIAVTAESGRAAIIETYGVEVKTTVTVLAN